MNPSFSQNSGEIALVLQLKNDSLLAGNLSMPGNESWLIKPDSIRKNDPVITLLSPPQNRVSYVDYGWEPSFSPDDKMIVYTGQVKPIGKKKIIAGALQGNSIKIFNKSTGAVSLLASPSLKFFLDPVFFDSVTVLFKTGDAVNGPFGGGVSLSRINLLSQKQEMVQMPEIKHQFYKLIGDVYKIKKKPAYIVYSPEDSGRGMANEYAHLLLSGKDTLHHFGIRRFCNLDNKIAIDKSDHIVYLDTRMSDEDTSFIVTYQGNNIIDKKPILFDYKEAFLSPGGRFLLYFTGDNEVFIANTGNFEKTGLGLPPKDIHSITWSLDGSKLAIVVDYPQKPYTDILYLFEVK